MYYDYGFWSPFHFLFGLIGWIIVIWIILMIFRGFRRRGHMHRGWYRDEAMDTLRERYAKGEINKEEFEAKKKDLMQ